MSEPQTSAKVVIHTIKGRIAIELWAKEKPKNVRRFLEVCQSGKLINESLCEVSKDRSCIMISKFDNDQDKSILALEHNSRIRFNKMGILGWDCTFGRWFVTLSAIPDNNEKIAIGKIVDGSVYSLRKLVDDSELDSEGLFLYPATIRSVEVTIPYFDDLANATYSKMPESHVKSPLKKMPLKKASRVQLSYDNDEESDGDESLRPMKRMRIKLPTTVVAAEAPQRLDDDCDKDAERRLQEATRDTIESEKSSMLDQKELKQDPPSLREQETLKMLSMFQKNTKGKSIIHRPS